MTPRQLAISLAAASLLWIAASGALAQEDEAPIVGRQLMTEEERDQYRAAMRTLETKEEREQARKEHHEKMQERAREHGVALPDQPMHRGDAGKGQGGGR